MNLEQSADALFSYLRDIIYDPRQASLDADALQEELRDLGKGLLFIGAMINETRDLSLRLSTGELDYSLPPPSNQLAAPLKKLHASLKHLTWQAQAVAKGNYNQRVDFMGEFSEAFNDMIAQLKQREQDSIAEKERLRSFVAKMSHELRTPMNAILGMSELALRETIEGPARSQVENINRAGRTLLSIINDVLDFSKIESGKLEITNSEYSPAELASDVCNLIRIQVEQKGLAFRFSAGELPERLVGDALRLQQIMINLLSNAVKYTDAGFVEFVVRGEYNGDDTFILHIAVRDSGKGIEEGNIATLFDEYTRFDAQSNKGVEGTGLGLAITKNLAVAMGGDINATSRYGAGSVFTATVPQKIPAESATTETAPVVEKIPFTAPDARVLVVDDVEMNLLVAEGVLEQYGMQIDLCESGADALEKIAATDYDIVFMDYMMPGMDGAETIAAIRASGKSLPIVMLTADVTAEALEKFIQFGANDTSEKPLNDITMNVLLRKWLPREKIM
ncbi:MAG: response regulator [Defluviitaleaceae bacterium]|nr:response regulator [Defluviitaleaceae bacterium]